jgi:hypothetical protein
MPSNVLKTVEDVVDWFEQRKERKGEQRELKIRQAKVSIRRHIANQRKMLQRLWKLGKRTLSLQDEAQFRRIGRLYLKTQEDVERWERYLLTFETLEARRDQVKATTVFLDALKEMNTSLMEAASPQAMAALQRDLAEGLARAETLEDRLAVMMEISEDTLAGEESLAPGEVGERLRELERVMSTEVGQEEADLYDARIQEGLRKIGEEMQR